MCMKHGRNCADSHRQKALFGEVRRRPVRSWGLIVRDIWFHLSVAVGSLLGLLLLVQSIATYYQVSRILVTAELRRQAVRQVATIERNSQRLGIREPAGLGEVLKEMREEEPLKIAWIRVIDVAGNTLIQDGIPIGLTDKARDTAALCRRNGHGLFVAKHRARKNRGLSPATATRSAVAAGSPSAGAGPWI
jgi:hypothetical protein